MLEFGFVYSEIGSRASSKNASTSSSPNNFEYSAAIAVFSYVQKRATQRTNQPLPTIETQENQVVIYFSKDEQAWVVSY